MDLRSAALLPAWLLLLAAAAAAAPAAGPAELPSYVELCDRNHPERDACYAESLQRLLPILANGSQELGLAALDPHLLPEMLLQYKQGQVAGKMLVRNTRSIGLSSAQVLAVRSNLNDSNKFHMEVDLYFPRIFMEGDYKAQGKIVVFPIEGKGVYNISLTGVSTTWNLTGTHIKKRNQGYVRLDHFYMFPEVEDMKVYASNLFTGNEDFSESSGAAVRQRLLARYLRRAAAVRQRGVGQGDARQRQQGLPQVSLRYAVSRRVGRHLGVRAPASSATLGVRRHEDRQRPTRTVQCK